MKDAVAAFNEAVWRGETKKIARLTMHIDPNGEDQWHRRPLAIAAQYGDVALVRRLLDRGAAVDAGRVYLTPITYAARRGAPDIVELLRGAGAIVSVATSIYLGDRAAVARESAEIVDEGGAPLLLHAAESLHADIVVDLLDRGVSIGASDRFGETALHRVADLRRTDGARAARIATVLLDRNAAVDARNRDEVTPLHQAVRARNLAVAEVLVARGADVNAGDKRGSTALHRAVSSTGAGGTAGADAAPLIALLLDNDADPDRRDKRGRSPRDAARPGALRSRRIQ